MANSTEKTVLHMQPRVPKYCISPDPAAIKLETFLRLAAIPHEVSFDTPKHPKTGETPWLAWQGENLANTSLIIERLSKDVNYDDGLSGSDASVARFLQKMIDEHTYWAGALLRWLHSDSGAQIVKQLSDARQLSEEEERAALQTWTDLVRFQAGGRGLGLLEAAQVKKVMADDVSSVARFLGDKPFMMGDRAHTVDCSVFGLMCQMLYVTTPETKAGLRAMHGNLVEYVERMKAQFYPDWDELIGLSE